MKRIAPLTVFLAVLLASVLAAGYAYYAGREASLIKLEATADDAVGRIMVRLEQHFSFLHATLAFFEAREGAISRASFRKFVSTIDVGNRSPGLQGIGFAGFAPKGEEIEIVRYLESEYETPITVWPQETDQGWRAPIVLLEPLVEVNRQLIGFDMFSEPERRAAMINAMRDAEPRASGPVHLGQEGQSEPQAGFVVYLAFPAGERAVGDTMPRFSTIEGFVYAPIRAADLFRAVIGHLPLSIEIYDGEAAPERLLFRSQTPPAGGFGETLVLERELAVAGRSWIARFQPTTAYQPPSSPIIPFAIAGFGLLLAATLALGARAREKAYEAMSALHQTSEKNLLEKDLMLQEMKHRIKNSIARVLAIARQTAVNAKTIEEFSDSFSARLQAMAASQDMLTRSRWQKADLKELLQTELDQVFGQSTEQRELTGPSVQLGEAATQALGLTFHELATNALKYGDIGSNGGMLKVSWQLGGNAPARRLMLIWEESNANGVQAPEKTGFGTRLIDANIQQELGGRIARHYRADGLKIVIDIPLS